MVAGIFEDFDNANVYNHSRARALDETTRNFIVDFGKNSAQIAFDVDSDTLGSLLSKNRNETRPVRWINIWAPNRQVDVIEELGHHYRFSSRLLAIMKTMPPDSPSSAADEVQQPQDFQPRPNKDDVELATTSLDTPRVTSSFSRPGNISQHDALKQMLNFQSVDVGSRFLCIGANWMHVLPQAKKEESILDEGSQRRLWSWLVLCDDWTVISLHEDPGPISEPGVLNSIRGNTLSVLSQVSILGHAEADPTSMQAVRQALDLEIAHTNPGVEGSSNLFYYLFDDWRAVYSTTTHFRRRLAQLESSIIQDIKRKSSGTPNLEIIPRLHVLGRRVRQMQGLYEGYGNLIQRIIESRSPVPVLLKCQTSGGVNIEAPGGLLAQTSIQRFERLGDRLKLLVLSGTQEFLAEKEALVTLYFNINTQKDSLSTARLTRSATLLAKLSVLFLPVSLMTSYFSIQVADIQGVYTIKEYWIVFAVLMSISFLGLFFFSRLLMWISETLDELIRGTGDSLFYLFYRGGKATKKNV